MRQIAGTSWKVVVGAVGGKDKLGQKGKRLQGESQIYHRWRHPLLRDHSLSRGFYDLSSRELLTGMEENPGEFGDSLQSQFLAAGDSFKCQFDRGVGKSAQAAEW